jgi:hypothetical protein
MALVVAAVSLVSSAVVRLRKMGRQEFLQRSWQDAGMYLRMTPCVAIRRTLSGNEERSGSPFGSGAGGSGGAGSDGTGRY